MTDPQRETDGLRLHFAMGVRRWFLILAAPVILFLTIASLMQWRLLWQWFIP